MIEEEDKNGENDRENDILAKVITVQALRAVLENEYSWNIVVIIDDLGEFGKTILFLPKECLNREKLRDYIEEIIKKKR